MHWSYPEVTILIIVAVNACDICTVIEYMGYAVAQLDEALHHKSEGRGFDSRWCHYGPGVYSASNRNEYQEYFLGGGGGGKAAGA